MHVKLTYYVVASKLDEILFMGRVSRMLYTYSTKLKDILNTTNSNTNNSNTTAANNKRDTHAAKLYNSSSSNSSIPRTPSKSMPKKEGECPLTSHVSINRV